LFLQQAQFDIGLRMILMHVVIKCFSLQMLATRIVQGFRRYQAGWNLPCNQMFEAFWLVRSIFPVL